jgi:hypothetical protein
MSQVPRTKGPDRTLLDADGVQEHILKEARIPNRIVKAVGLRGQDRKLLATQGLVSEMGLEAANQER